MRAGDDTTPTHRDAAGEPAVVDLRDPRARDVTLVGAKAANLARAAAAGVPVLPGFAVTVTAPAGVGAEIPGLRPAWERCRAGGRDAVVVRSSSSIEDAAESSMAGQFTTVLDVTTWEAFVDAVARVRASAAGRTGGPGPARPMGVLVQPQLDPVVSGVLFGFDPVHGDRHTAVDVVAGRPDALVSGRVTAAHYVLHRSGRAIEHVPAAGAPALPLRQRRRLVRLAGRAAAAFGTPQDVEWAIDAHGRLWLLQARPITTSAPAARGAVLGPGPVAETFPAALRPLDEDLWLVPLRDGIVRALRATGAVAPGRIARSPVLTTIGGRPAVDLALLGVHVERHPLRFLNPVPPARRLGAAWRVGRLRLALDRLAAAVVARVDTDLAAIPRLDLLDESALFEVIERARRELTTVHSFEVLAGMLRHDTAAASGTALALAALARGRAQGLDDAVIVERHPEVLALVAPRADGPVVLPPVAPPGGEGSGAADSVDALGPRDALRLRARWLQELLGRAAGTVAERLAERGALGDPGLARELTVAELLAVAGGAALPADVEQRRARTAGPPLPVAFRMAADGTPIALEPRGHGRPPHDGVAASGGRAEGIVRHRVPAGLAHDDTVLVVAHLEPELAAVLPHVAAIVAETGSPLSHLAILAREHHVPAVVGVPHARRRFAAGTRVLVDGSTGEVTVLDRVPEAVGT